MKDDCRTSQLLYNISNMFSCIHDLEIMLSSIVTVDVDIQDTAFALGFLIEEATTNNFFVNYIIFTGIMDDLCVPVHPVHSVRAREIFPRVLHTEVRIHAQVGSRSVVSTSPPMLLSFSVEVEVKVEDEI
jgi:hypothetical protein